VSGAQPPQGPQSQRIGIAISVLALIATVVGFTWIAVKTSKFIGSPEVVSKLEPVKVIGSAHTVFSWKKNACEPRDIPDAPARAFRDARGTVHLVASHYVNRQLTGPDLARVKHSCAVIMRSAYDQRPSEFSDREWIAAPYTLDGKTVFSLMHNEYQGYNHPGRCASGLLTRCWYNAITLARSDDGGATFHLARPAPGHLVGEVPYRYTPDAGVYGLFQPSNIVSRKGYYYALAYTQPYRAQESGTCLLRTNRLDDPSSWRAWGGDGYNVQLVDPYRVRVSAADHVCKPVDPEAIAQMSQSLTYNTYFGRFLLVGTAGDYNPRKRRNVIGFYYSLSDDLVHWSKRKLIRETETVPTYRCGDRDPVAYPSVLDPKSKSRNFETTGRRPYLYFTRFHYKACQETLDRDLVRVPVEFSK
jgi:hypothetical protein